nr:MAG TPA: hypothetical protein [Caudoviricetes sp.]
MTGKTLLHPFNRFQRAERLCEELRKKAPPPLWKQKNFILKTIKNGNNKN